MGEGVFFCKKVENGFFCKKKWTFPQCSVHYVQYQYFLFYILLIWGCVRTQCTPLPTCLKVKMSKIKVAVTPKKI